MKKLIVLFLITSLILLISCSSENNPAGPISPSDSLLVSGIITDTGGEFGNDDFTLSISEGAFNTDTELALYETSNEPYYDSTGCTKTFMLEGLPDVLFESVKIKLRYEGALSDSSYIVVGYAISNEGTDSALIVNEFLTCSDSSGYLSAELSGLFGESYRKENPFNKALVRNARLYIKGVTAMMEAQTDNGHFLLIFPFYRHNMIPYLEEYLEGAYHEFGSARAYDYAMAKPWGHIDNIRVEVRNFSQFLEEEHNKYVIDLTTYHNDNGGYDFYLIVNEKYLTSSFIDELKSAVYQEFFRIVQEAHIKTDQAQDEWFHEASARWMGGEYKNSPPNLSDDFAGNEMAPFNGFYAGASVGHKKHGKGMTAFIEFLMRDQGSYSNLRLIYSQLHTDMGAMDAIIHTLEDDPFDWITEFYQKYVSATFTNSNYDVSPSVFAASSNLAGTLNITSAEDKEQSFNTSIAEGGARLFKINLSPQIFGDNTASIDLAAVSDDVDLGDLQILVFEYNNNQLAYLTQGLTVKMTDLEDYADDNSDLYVAIVNTSLTSPTYDHIADVTFNTEVKVAPDDTFDFTYCTIGVGKIDATYLKNNGNIVTGEFSLGLASTTGSFDGSYYHGYPYNSDQGEVEIWIDTESMVIDSLHATTETSVVGGNIIKEIKAQSIPYDKIDVNGDYYFEIMENNTCSTIESISEERVGEQFHWYIMQAYDCNSESYIRVIFRK